jgi:hypothetical protein
MVVFLIHMLNNLSMVMVPHNLVTVLLNLDMVTWVWVVDIIKRYIINSY